MGRGTALTAMMVALGRAGAIIVLVLAAGAGAAAEPAAKAPVTVIIVRHGESGRELFPVGHKRAALLAKTLQDVRLTNIFATHTRRARQTVEPVAAAQKLPIVQLPAPGSMLEGLPVTDDTSRQAAIGPITRAVLALPPGSVALVAANQDNIYGILNGLGVPVAAAGKGCARGSLCVPCLTKECFPDDYDRMWTLVLPAGTARPLTLLETRYTVGWVPGS